MADNIEPGTNDRVNENAPPTVIGSITIEVLSNGRLAPLKVDGVYEMAVPTILRAVANSASKALGAE